VQGLGFGGGFRLMVSPYTLNLIPGLGFRVEDFGLIIYRSGIGVQALGLTESDIDCLTSAEFARQRPGVFFQRFRKKSKT